MLDMLHYLDDAALRAALEQVFARLAPGGFLLVRHAQPPRPKPSWRWRLEDRRVRFAGHPTHYRDPKRIAALLAPYGCSVLVNRPTDRDPELAWLLCRKQ